MPSYFLWLLSSLILRRYTGADIVFAHICKLFLVRKLPPKFTVSGNKLTVRQVCRDCPPGVNQRSTDLMVIQCNASNVHGYAFGSGYLNVLREFESTGCYWNVHTNKHSDDNDDTDDNDNDDEDSDINNLIMMTMITVVVMKMTMTMTVIDWSLPYFSWRQ